MSRSELNPVVLSAIPSVPRPYAKAVAAPLAVASTVSQLTHLTYGGPPPPALLPAACLTQAALAGASTLLSQGSDDECMRAMDGLGDVTNNENDDANLQAAAKRLKSSGGGAI